MDNTNTENFQMSEVSFDTPYDFEHPADMKLPESFVKTFFKNLAKANKPPIWAITGPGLTSYAHYKGILEEDLEILQYPTKENNYMCICKCTVVGYGWSPIEKKIVPVKFSDIGDACPDNCGVLVKDAYIRMASKRAKARAYRQYTNIDVLCDDEVYDKLDGGGKGSGNNNYNSAPPSQPQIQYATQEQLTEMRQLLMERQLPMENFVQIISQYGVTDPNYCTRLTTQNAAAVNNYLRGLAIPQK